MLVCLCVLNLQACGESHLKVLRLLHAGALSFPGQLGSILFGDTMVPITE